MSEVTVLIGAGLIGQAIARRVSLGRHIVVADLSQEKADAVAQDLFNAGFETNAVAVNVSSRESVQKLADRAVALGPVKRVIQAAGVSPSQASIEQILQVDLYGTALVLELFGNIIAEDGTAVVISSQSGYRLPALTPEEDEALALTPTEELLGLPLVQNLESTLHAYQLSKRANGLRVKGEAPRWGKRGARVNSISPGIIYTPLARDELNGINAQIYRTMLEKSPVGRGGNPDEVAALAETVMGENGRYISGSDFLMDGGVTASWYYGDLRPTD